MPRLSSRTHLKRIGVTVGLIVLGSVVGYIGLSSGGRPEMTIGATLLAAVALDALAARFSVSPVGVSLHGPPEAIAGHESEWVLQATDLRRPVVVTPAQVPRTPRFIVRNGAPALITLPPFPRGMVTTVALDITATGPLGLYQAGRRVLVPLSSPLAVGPLPQPVEVEWPKPKAVGFGLTHGAPLGDDLFRSIRPYQRGDERRRIHWASTAHHGRLMVRENDGTGVVALRVVVDPGYPGVLADQVTGVAATIVLEALGRGWLVQLVTADAEVERAVPAEPRNPFKGPYPTVPFAFVSTVTRAERVTGARAVNRQLATAVPGPVVVPAWPGLVCHVGPGGVSWA